jgi:DNA-binding Lrp family transcriptional regulator
MAGFSSERELVNLFKSTYYNKFDVENTRMLEEVGLGFGFADLVIAELKESLSLPKREKLSPIDINVYQVVSRKKKVSLENVKRITGIRQNEVRKSLERLVDDCFIKKIDSYFELNVKYKLPFKKSIAFEAKLSNWKRAITQAYRYKWFADYSYVVMDEAHANQAIRNLSQFENYNVGLLTISVDGNIKTYYRPQKQLPIDPAMQMMFSEEILYQ